MVVKFFNDGYNIFDTPGLNNAKGDFNNIE